MWVHAMTALSQTVDLGAGQALGVGPATIMGISFGEEIEGEEAAAEMQAFLGRHSHQSWYPEARNTWDEWTAVKAWESGLWRTIDARPLLAKIECRTPVLVGGPDLICGPAHGRLIAEAVPSAELVIVPDSGHFIAAEAPESFRDEIIKFAG